MTKPNPQADHEPQFGTSPVENQTSVVHAVQAMTTPSDTSNELDEILDQMLIDWNANSKLLHKNGLSTQLPTKKNAKAALTRLIAAEKVKELEALSMEVVEPCEEDCDPVRHARHQGTWQAHLVIDDRIATLRQSVEGNMGDVPTTEDASES